MNYLSVFILSIFLFSACQNSSGEGEETTAEETNETEQTSETPEATDEAPDLLNEMGAEATTEVSDEELKQFASALQQMQMMNQMAQQRMVAAVQDAGLEVERFSAIRQAQEAPDQTTDATEDELAKVDAAVAELEKIQEETNAQMVAKIEAAGLTEARYQEIGQALQNSQALQAKFQELMAPPAGAQAPQGQAQPQ